MRATSSLYTQNGGYVNPPAIKRQFRDPYADWWDKQERRNYGEPVHEDDDILGMFSPYEYTHVTPGKGLFQLGCFVAAVFGLAGVVSLTYPDTPSAPREFEGGLERELGGPGAVRVSCCKVFENNVANILSGESCGFPKAISSNRS